MKDLQNQVKVANNEKKQLENTLQSKEVQSQQVQQELKKAQESQVQVSHYNKVIEDQQREIETLRKSKESTLQKVNDELRTQKEDNTRILQENTDLSLLKEQLQDKCNQALSESEFFKGKLLEAEDYIKEIERHKELALPNEN